MDREAMMLPTKIQFIWLKGFRGIFICNSIHFFNFFFICFFNSQEFTFIKKPVHYHLTWMYNNDYVTIAFFKVNYEVKYNVLTWLNKSTETHSFFHIYNGSSSLIIQQMKMYHRNSLFRNRKDQWLYCEISHLR